VHQSKSSQKRGANTNWSKPSAAHRTANRLKSYGIWVSRGYNKYLKLKGDVSIEINYEKFEQDKKWNGLKGYTTNMRFSKEKGIENYHNLWHIEKAFRTSKTDLRIRPIYHRFKHRIQAHICIAFTAYCIHKELERVLYKEKSNLSPRKVAELTHNMYQIIYTLPDSKTH